MNGFQQFGGSSIYLRIEAPSSKRLKLKPTGAETLLTTERNVEKSNDDCHALPG